MKVDEDLPHRWRGDKEQNYVLSFYDPFGRCYFAMSKYQEASRANLMVFHIGLEFI